MEFRVPFVDLRNSNIFSLSFWVFLEDKTKMGDNLVNVILSKNMMISIGIDNNKLTSWCNPYLQYASTLETTTSKIEMDKINSNTNYSTMKATPDSYSDGSWLYTRCAVNLDGFTAYNLIDNTKMVTPIINEKTTLEIPYYYTTSRGDVPFKYFYGDFHYLRINNAGSLLTSSSKTSFYLRGLTLISEYIPKNSQIQYFDFSSFTSNSSFPGLYILITPEWSASSNTISGKYFNKSGSITVMNFATKYKTNYNKYSYLDAGFFRLNLASPNQFWGNAELKPDSTKKLNCLANSYCFKNNKQINCPKNKYYNLDTDTCNDKCPNNTLPSFGSFISTGNISTGYCSHPCNVGLKSNVSCDLTATDFFKTYNCKTGFIDIYMRCIDTTDVSKGAFNYNGAFGYQALINIPINSTINYLVDFWLFTDIVYNPTPINSSTNYFIWYTDSIGIVRKNNDKSLYQIVGPDGSELSNTFILEYGQWYNIVYSVKNNDFTLLLSKKSNATPIKFTYTKNLTFSNIYFCNEIACGPINGTIRWASGYYRNIKVWPGEYMNMNMNKNLKRYWTFLSSPSYRFSTLNHYYPMNIKNIDDENIIDPDMTPDADVSPSGSYVNKIQPWNYSSNFDQVETNTYVSNLTFNNGFYTPNFTDCPTGCEFCNNLECFGCLNTHELKDGDCVLKSGYMSFLAPAYVLESQTPADTRLKPIPGITTSFTVSFFVKLLGWAANSTSYDIFRYGTGMVLKYNISKNELYLTDGSTNFATSSNFYALFGKWINISFSYFYDSTINTTFPAMMNFQVNFQNKKISGNFANKSMNALVIPKESIGVYSRLWISPVYMTGPWAEISNRGRAFTFTKFIDNEYSGVDCVKTSDIINHIDLECNKEYDNILNEQENWCLNIYSFVTTETPQPFCKPSVPTCIYGYYSPDQLCGCATDPTIKTVYPSLNSGDNKCKKHDFVDFGQTKTTTISDVGVSGTEYTMESWVYINNYVTGSFVNGFEIKWDKHMMIKLKYDNSKYVSICYPFYDKSDSSKEHLNSSTIQIYFRAWVYVRCSVSNTLKKYFHFKEEDKTSEITLSGISPTVGTSTTLEFNNYLINNGLIYLKQLRLWKCYRCQMPDTYKLDITSLSVQSYPDLLHLWNPTYDTGSYPPQVIDIKSSKNFTPVIDSSFRGYNVVDLTEYKFLNSSNGLCSETTQSCTGLLPINEISDVSLPTLPSTTGRYTIEMWAMVSSLSGLNNGFHVIWRNLVSISFSKSSTEFNTFNIYGWPLDYQVENEKIKGNSNIENQAKIILNDKLQNSNYTGGIWVQIRCAVSTNMNKFYMSNNPIKEIQGSTMWQGQRSDVPFKLTWKNGVKTNLIITGANSITNTNTNIYIRQIMLYNEYLPQLLTFNNHDMSRISSATMKSQIFSISFFNYFKQMNIIYYTDDATSEIIYNPIFLSSDIKKYTKDLNVPNQCDPSKNHKLINGICTSIDSISTNALLCQDENSPIICKENFNWDEVKFKNNPSTACSESCSPPYTRSPDSTKKGDMCNFKCDQNASCPTSAADQLDLANKFTCNPGYDKIGFKCLDSTIASKSQLYFNGCLNFPNISFDFKSSQSKFENGHTIQFWMKIDRFNEFCSSNNKRKYYFLLEPHLIYLDSESTIDVQTGKTLPNGFYNIVYENMISKTLKGTLASLNPLTWNVITIQVTSLNNSNSIKVYTNNNFFKPDINLENINIGSMIISKLVFCSSTGQISDNSLCSSSSYANNITWGAAFYKDIKIWAGLNTNAWLIQQVDNKITPENTNTLLYHFPMNVKNSIDNKIQNIASLGGSIDVLSRYPSLSPDREYVLNYASKFAYSDLNPGKIMNTFDLVGGSFTTTSCTANCNKCTSPLAQSCIECATGYKIYSNVCRPFNGYFTKIPISLQNTFLSLKVDLNSELTLAKRNIFTWTIWIKYIGEINQNTANNYCVTLIRLKKDGSKYICYNPNSRTLNFYDRTNILYQDSTFFNYIGQWVLLALSSFVRLTKATGTVVETPNQGVFDTQQYAFYVHDQEVSKSITYSIPDPGLNIDTFDIGYEFSGYVADFRLYKDFIVNPYGVILSSSKNSNISLQHRLSGETATSGCITDENLNLSLYNNLPLLSSETSYSKKLGALCVSDFLPYSLTCADSTSYFDYTKLTILDTPCFSCAKNCSGSCARSDSLSCSCSFMLGKDWLKVDPVSKKLFCETPTYVDFSRGKMNIDPIKVASAGEYSIEFWFYIYSYNNKNILFDSHEIIWDQHNYIKIYKNDRNGISVRYSPVYDNKNRQLYIGSEAKNLSGPNELTYNDVYENLSLITNNNSIFNNLNNANGISIGSFYNWVYVQCSSSIPRKLYQTNYRNPSKINYKDENIPNLKNLNSTSLIIQPGNMTNMNYGFIFLREIKLWSKYDIRHFWTNCNPGKNYPLYYTNNLIHYFKNDNQGDNIYDSFSKSSVTGSIIKSPQFLGYNEIKVAYSNSTVFPDIEDCHSELKVFPNTGYSNSTLFLIFIKEDEKILGTTLSYRFYYRIKDTDEEIEINDISSKKETSSKFSIDVEKYLNGNSDGKIFLDLFCDILYKTGRKITLFAEMSLMKNIKFDPVLTNEKLLSFQDLNDETPDHEILSRIQLMSELQSDLPYSANKGLGFNQDIDYSIFNGDTINQNNTTETTLTNNSNINNDIIYDSSFYAELSSDPLDPNYNSKIQSTIPSILSLSCKTGKDTNYCNDRGLCYEAQNSLFCKCFPEYMGRFCQTRRIVAETWLNTSNKYIDILNKDISKFQVDRALIKAVDTLIESSSILLNASDTQKIIKLNSLMNSLRTALSKMNREVLRSSLTNYCNIAKNLYTNNIMHRDKHKYDVVHDLLLKNYTFTDALKPYFNTYLTVEYYDITNILSTARIFSNNTISLDFKLLAKPNMTYILRVYDPSYKIQISPEYTKFAETVRVSVKVFIADVFINQFRLSKQNDTFEYIHKNDFYLIHGKKISDIYNFDFMSYYVNRMKLTQSLDSFIDVGDAIKKFLKYLPRDITLYNLSTVYFIHYESKIPEKNVKLPDDCSLITTAHSLRFYDANLKVIELGTNKGYFYHYLPLRIHPRDFKGQAFFRELMLSPDKYENSHLYTLDFIPRYFIHSNGTIDHSPLSVQLPKYFRTFDVRTVYFDSSIQNFKSKGIFFLNAKQKGYLIARSVHKLDPVTTTMSPRPLLTNYKNHYFIDKKFKNLYTCKENFKSNKCFYVVIILFTFHIFILFFLWFINFFLLILRKGKIKENFINEYENYLEEITNNNKNFGEFRYKSTSDEAFEHIVVWKKDNKKMSKDEKEYTGIIFSNGSYNIKISTNSGRRGNISNKMKNRNYNKPTKYENEIYSQRENIPTEQNFIETYYNDSRNDSNIILFSSHEQEKNSYNLLFFILKKSIYGNAFDFKSTSPFVPKYKAFSKLIYLIYSLVLIVNVFCVFYDMDLTVIILINFNFRIITSLSSKK